MNASLFYEVRGGSPGSVERFGGVKDGQFRVANPAAWINSLLIEYAKAGDEFRTDYRHAWVSLIEFVHGVLSTSAVGPSANLR